MRTSSEREVRNAIWAAEAELVGFVEHGLVAVRGGERQQRFTGGGERAAAEIGSARDVPEEHGHRWVQPQHLLDESGYERLVVVQRVERRWHRRDVDEDVREEVPRRFAARLEHERHDRQDLVVGQTRAVHLGADQLRDEVVSIGVRAASSDHLVEVPVEIREAVFQPGAKRALVPRQVLAVRQLVDPRRDLAVIVG